MGRNINFTGGIPITSCLQSHSSNLETGTTTPSFSISSIPSNWLPPHRYSHWLGPSGECQTSVTSGPSIQIIVGVVEITGNHCAHPPFSFVLFLSCYSLVVSLIYHFYKAKRRNPLPRWYTMCEDPQHWPGSIGEETKRWSGILDEMGTGTPLLYANPR